VTQFWLQQRADERGVPLVLLTLRDLVPDGEHGAVLLDWDSLDQERREELLSRLLSRPGSARIGLHSYSLNEQDAENLRRKGVTVLERFDPEAVHWLLGNGRGPTTG
jgi:hypothetical protein